MSLISFPHPVIPQYPNSFRCVSGIRELAQHSQILTDWSLRYDQLSQGPFEGNLKEAWLDGIQFYEEQLSRAVFQTGETRGETLCLGVFNQLSGDTRWMGKPLTLDDITWSYRGGELMLQTPEHSSLLVLSIPLNMLDDFDEELPRMVCSVHHADLSARIRQQIVSTLQNLMVHPLHMANRQARLQFQSDIRGLAFDFFNVVQQHTEPVKYSLQKAQKVVTKAQDALLAHPDTPFTVDLLCQMTHTSRRTLQNCFESVTGLSPAMFLKNMRLNAVKRLLVMGDESLNISEIAARWGFWHLSQFSTDYKRLFGELPSQTLKVIHRTRQ